jgi:MFS family permease
MIDTSSLRDLPYMLAAVATGIGTDGLTILNFYISFYSENRGLTSTSLAFYMVAIFNAGSVLGRVLPNAMSDRVGPFNIVTPSAVGAAAVSFCMIAARNQGGIIVLALMAGFFSGVFIAMPSVCFAHLTKDKSKLGTRIGMGYFFSAILSLPGGPGAGAILGYTGELDWTWLWIFGGLTFCVSCLLYAWVRLLRSRGKIFVKA